MIYANGRAIKRMNGKRRAETITKRLRFKVYERPDKEAMCFA